MGDGGMKSVNFCYQCGRRLSKQQDHCWYCNAPIREFVRPPKRCPFCKEPVQPEAIKCKHCGEFIDGRPRPEERPSQVIFVVDKDLLRAARDFRLTAGQPVPPDVARVLDAQTVRAIEAGQPALVQSPGVRALPAPAAGALPEPVEVEAEELPVVASKSAKADGAGRTANTGRELVRAGGQQGALVRAEGRSRTPMAQQSTALVRSAAAPPAKAGGLVGQALGGLVKWIPKPRPQAPRDPNTLDAETHDLYRVCERCGADILVSDNYCYHCDMQFHMTRADVHQRRKYMLGRAAKAPYILALLVTAALWVQRAGFISLPFAHANLALGGAAALFVAIGLLRGRGVKNWIAAGVTGIIMLAVFLGLIG